METVRNKLRDIKSSIVGTIEEKKLINAQIEAIRNAKRAMEDQVKAARASVSDSSGYSERNPLCQQRISPP